MLALESASPSMARMVSAVAHLEVLAHALAAHSDCSAGLWSLVSLTVTVR